jgi:prevent-host-death family protein
MQLTITKLRERLFDVVERASNGEPIQFSYKGRMFRIVPEEKPSKLKRLQAQKVLRPGGMARAQKQLLKEMQAEWEKDWAEL